MRYIASFFILVHRVFDRLCMYIMLSLFKSHGKNILFYPTNSFIFYKNIILGSDIAIGPRATLVASLSNIFIGDNVLFGPNVTIIAGNHSSHIIGKLLSDYKISDKLEQDDRSVIIENDVWVGANVTILNGVTIGRGSIIAAGSVVIKNVKPYSIVGGVPAKFIKHRWSLEQIIKHEEILYDINNRIDIKNIE